MMWFFRASVVLACFFLENWWMCEKEASRNKYLIFITLKNETDLNNVKKSVLTKLIRQSLEKGVNVTTEKRIDVTVYWLQNQRYEDGERRN